MDDNLPPLGTPPPPIPPSAPPPPPPIILAPAKPRPAKSGLGWKIFALLLLIALIFTVCRKNTHIGQKPGRALQQGEQPLDEILVEDNGSQNKIALIEVEGVITSSPISRTGRSIVDSIQDQLEAAGRDPHVRAVVLKINSPGGEVLASDEIYNSVRDFQTGYHKPVIASMQTVAASGGYYVAAPCQWIVANEMTITGSICVIMHGYNYRGLLDKIGVRPDVYKSGRYKNMMSGDRREDEIPDEEREMVQGLIDEVYGKFTNIVATGRQLSNTQNKGDGQKLASDWTEYADGRVVSGKQALKIGLVDELGNFSTALDRAMDLANIQNADVIRYEEPFGLGNFLKIFGETKTSALKVDLGLEMPKLEVGRLYFIAPTTLP